MTLDKQVAGLLKRYLDFEYEGSIPKEVFKNLASKLNMFPLSLSKITSLIETQGYAVVYEPLLVYNKEEQYARLTMTPAKDEQVITKLSFDPVLYRAVMSACELRGYLSTGIVVVLEHNNFVAYSNFLIIANNVELLKSVKSQYQILI